jgi:hypothetical protein
MTDDALVPTKDCLKSLLVNQGGLVLHRPVEATFNKAAVPM